MKELAGRLGETQKWVDGQLEQLQEELRQAQNLLDV
jgi:hypothetical protein